MGWTSRQRVVAAIAFLPLIVLAADRPDVLLDRLAGWRGAPAAFTWVDR